MSKKRIAFITESKERKASPTPAHLFYQGSHNRWVNKIIEYMLTREFDENDAYFLSYYNHRIFSFNETVEPYPETPDPNGKQREAFAEKIIQFLEENYDGPESILVELHVSRLKYDKFIKKLDAKGYEYIVYADGKPLGEKPRVYEELIQECNDRRKLKEIQTEKYNLIRLVPHKTPEEAKVLYDTYLSKAQLFGIEDIMEELRVLLKDHWQAKKAVQVAEREALDYISAEGEIGEELKDLFHSSDVLSDLFQNVSLFEMLKSNYGKAMAKVQRYLTKVEYTMQKEMKIRAALLKMQIVLMK